MSKQPTRKELLAELCRLKAENERLRRLVTTQRPELRRLRELEVGLRDYLDNGAEAIVRLHAECKALLQGCDDLPSIDELIGIFSDGKARVDAALESESNAVRAHAKGEPA